METDTYIDRERFKDGSHRWLWRVMVDGRLWRAGVEHSLEDATRAAHRSWDEYQNEHAIVDAATKRSPWGMHLADFDRIDQGDGNDPPPAA